MTEYINHLFSDSHTVKPLAKRIEHVRSLLADADGVLVGAGSGLSTAAGLVYDGDDFHREFRPWIERYGFTDLYTSSFYDFQSPEESWAYWARHIWFCRFRIDALPLYEELLHMLGGKDYFVLTTNTDGQFVKAGFAADRVFACQGDYAYLQTRSGQPRKLYYNKEMVEEMMRQTDSDLRIPSSLIPYSPDTGEALVPNLRVDDNFVEDNHWHEMADRYYDFIERHRDSRLLLLELGVGFNTPGIIRFPFEQMASALPHASLVRLNKEHPHTMTDGIRDFTAFSEDISSVIGQLSEPAS